MKNFGKANIILIKSDTTASIGSIFKATKLTAFHDPTIDKKVGELLLNRNTNVKASNEYYEHYKMYVVTDDSFQSGDWAVVKFLTGNPNENNPCFEYKVIQIGEITRDVIYDMAGTFKIVRSSQHNFCKKIVASDDETLKIADSGAMFGSELKSLPRPKRDFIEEYIIEYNKGNIISDVSILLNEPCCKCDTSEKLLNCCYNVGDIEGTCNAPNPNKDFYGLYPKVNPDDTINISIPGMDLKRLIKINPVIENEIFNLCEKAYNDGILSNCGESFSDWFNENVK